MAAKQASTSPVPAFTPAARSSWAKPTRTPVNGSSPALPTGDDLRQVLSGPVEVVAVLDARPERVTGGAAGQVGLAEHAERANPVDRLGDARRLGQVKLAQPVDGVNALPGEVACRGRLAELDDLRLAGLAG